MQPIDTITSNIDNLQKLYDKWSTASNILIVTVIILGALLAWVQYKTSKSSEKLNEAKDKLILTRDKQQALQITTLKTESLKAKEEIAKAQAQAAEANRIAEEERLARVKMEISLLPRTLTNEQKDILIKTLSSVIPDDKIKVSSIDSPEAKNFAEQIKQILIKIGWNINKKPSIKIPSIEGIIIKVPDLNNPPKWASLLAQTLNKIGFPSIAERAKEPEILIGEKPQYKKDN